MSAQFLLIRDGATAAARPAPMDSKGNLALQSIVAMDELLDMAETGDELVLLRHSTGECMCPDELGTRDGCTIVHSVVWN